LELATIRIVYWDTSGRWKEVVFDGDRYAGWNVLGSTALSSLLRQSVVEPTRFHRVALGLKRS
jgi:hypothetical protein